MGRRFYQFNQVNRNTPTFPAATVLEVNFPFRDVTVLFSMIITISELLRFTKRSVFNPTMQEGLVSIHTSHISMETTGGFTFGILGNVVLKCYANSELNAILKKVTIRLVGSMRVYTTIYIIMS